MSPYLQTNSPDFAKIFLNPLVMPLSISPLFCKNFTQEEFHPRIITLGGRSTHPGPPGYATDVDKHLGTMILDLGLLNLQNNPSEF